MHARSRWIEVVGVMRGMVFYRIVSEAALIGAVMESGAVLIELSGWTTIGMLAGDIFLGSEMSRNGYGKM